MELAGPVGRCERYGLLLLLGVFCAFGVFDHSLWAPNDPREGAMIWDMFRSGNWTKLSLNGTAFLEKPPLLHWTALVFCRLFGRIDEGLVRLPAALYGFGALLIVYQWGRRLGRERAGLLGAFLCATTLMYSEYSRIVLTDICLTFMVTVSLHAFWTAYSAARGRVLRYGGFLLSTALAFYAKGFLGPGLVMTSVVVFLLLRREWKLALLLPLVLVPLLATVILPWAAALYHEGGSEYLISAFIDNQLGRFFELPRGAAVTSLPIVGSCLEFMASRPIPSDPYFVHREPFYYYLTELPTFLLPWTLLIPPALWHWFKRGRSDTSPLDSFLRCAFFTIVAVLQVSSTKVGCYALPLYPILFLMIGVWCDELSIGPVARLESWLLRATTTLLRPLLFVLPCACLIWFALPTGVYRQLDRLLRGLGFDSDMGDPSKWAHALGATVVWRGAGLCVIALVLAILARRRARARSDDRDRAGGMLKVTALLVSILMLTLSAAMPIYDHQRTYKPIAELVRKEIAAGRRVALAVRGAKDVGEFNFYVDMRLPEISLIPGACDFLRLDAEPRGVVVDVDDLERLREPLRSIDHEILEVTGDAGFKSQEFRLITTR